MYSFQCWRSLTSPAENFQFLSGSSSRSKKRLFCSALETCRKNLQIGHPVARQIAFDGVDVFEALVPDALAQQAVGNLLARQQLGMDSHDESLFVIGAVEDSDPAALGQVAEATPHEIVVDVFMRGGLEGM